MVQNSLAGFEHAQNYVGRSNVLDNLAILLLLGAILLLRKKNSGWVGMAKCL